MQVESPKPKHIFYILTKHSKEPIRDFQQLVISLHGNWGLNVIQNSPTSAQISNNMGYSADITLLENNQFSDQGFRMCVEVTLNAEDEATFHSIRYVLNNSRFLFHLYSEKYQAFIPRDLDLHVAEVGSYNVETYRLLHNFSFTPLYYYDPTRTYYASDSEGKVVIINRALMNFMFDKEIPEREMPELSYVVAENVKKFGYMFERNLIPKHFYQYYRKPFKIINDSFININNPGRKVFIKPYIFELLEERNEFYTQAGDGSSLLFMDKIRKEETLDQSIIRILSQDLHIADDYIGAYVAEDVEFDRDKEGILTPRLIVLIYVNTINNRDWALKMSQTSWRSLDGSLASQPSSSS